MTNVGEVVRLLAENRVRFILIGGAAANVYGSGRHTEDVDVVYDRRPENVDRLVAAIRPFKPILRGAPEGVSFVWDERTIKSGLNFTLSTSWAKWPAVAGTRTSRKKPRPSTRSASTAYA